jgi:hypothetical protein
LGGKNLALFAGLLPGFFATYSLEFADSGLFWTSIKNFFARKIVFSSLSKGQAPPKKFDQMSEFNIANKRNCSKI